MRILVVEDEFKLGRAIKRALELQKYAVDTSLDGLSGLDMALGESYDLIILDIMLPQMSGIEVCQKIRQEAITTPILMLTAKGEISDKVRALDAGADDYLTKPFSFEELFARIRALIRRSNKITGPILQIEDLSLDPATFKVKRGQKVISLTTREFALLEFLMRNKNTIVSKEQIIAHIWDYDANILSGTVEVHIKNLRDKIDAQFNFHLIQTVRGFGYRLSLPSD